MNGWNGYLRVVVTARCSLACSYCHLEGDPAGAAPGGLDTETLGVLLAVAGEQGLQKLKFLGGEPLLRADLPAVIGAVRSRSAGLDISLITGGAVPTARIRDCFQAGLSRANLSIHGWSAAEFQSRTGKGPRAWALRNAALAALLEEGRFLKLNFVWRGPADAGDLGALLAWAATRPVVVAVLDDLGDPSLGPASVRAAVEGLRGAPARAVVEPDPCSLPTLRLSWGDGLVVEIKHEQLGQVAPWASCGTCPLRARCREGIVALRLTHEGRLLPCLDRPDLAVDLAGALRSGGIGAARRTFAAALEAWAPPASLPLAA
jgi:cyclic pyranopterin phosphate synthase